MYITYPETISPDWYEKTKVVNVETAYGHYLEITHENGLKIYRFVSNQKSPEVNIPQEVFSTVFSLVNSEQISMYTEYAYVNEKYTTDLIRDFYDGTLLKYNYGD